MTEDFVFHGSNQTVTRPKILVQGFYKDFGYGFYCTKIEKQAIRWAMTKKNPHIVNVYRFKAIENLDIKFFPNMSEEWLDFIAACRTGKEHEPGAMKYE